MKKILICSIMMMGALTSCNSFLDIHPDDTFTNTPAYWSNTDNLDNQCNTFLNNYLGYGNGSSYGWFYFKALSDDQVDFTDNNWTFTNVVASSADWKSAYETVRHANYVLTGLAKSSLSYEAKATYEGIAKLNRAWTYYQLVRQYGDVPFINTVVNTADEEILYGPRINRDVVMDSVLNDLNYAAEHITQTNKQRFTADMALAMKADVALYEGTYCKYRTVADNAGKGPDLTRAQRFLNECADACTKLMTKDYHLNASYKGNYNSTDLSKNPEMIFYKPYSKGKLTHSTINYTMNTSGTNGMTKDAFDAYLFLDGKPKATTSLATNDAATLNANNQYGIEAQLAVRDKRLAETIDPVLAFKGHAYQRAGTHAFTSTTGYAVSKYDNTTELTIGERNNNDRQYTDCPIFWLSVVYLDYAEAKAELGTITQTDLDNSINKLQIRAGLPGIQLAPAADPANNMGVSNLLWEIRRARRCELMFDNWTRYWDLIRWHQLHLIDSEQHPNVYLGANISNVPNPEVDVNSNGYMIGSNTLNQVRRFDKKYYFYPIPTGQITLSNLTQNPGW